MILIISHTLKKIFVAIRGTIGLEQFWEELTNGYNREPYDGNSAFGEVNSYFYDAMDRMWSNTGIQDIITKWIT